MNGTRTQTESNFDIINQVTQNKFMMLKYYLENYGKKDEQTLRDTVENGWQNAIYNGIDTVDTKFRQNNLDAQTAANLSALLMEQLQRNYHLNPSNQRGRAIKDKYLQLIKDVEAPMDIAMQYVNPNTYDATFDYNTILSLVA